MSESPDKAYNLLTEPIFNLNIGEKDRSLNLPAILASLSKESPIVISFNGLMPHQKQAWYSFLVQLGAIACYHGDLYEPPTEEKVWREILRNLTSDWPEDEPWYLVVNDLSQPAFFQPPVPEGTLKAFNCVRTPDIDATTDLLVLSKNHDVKRGRIEDPSAEYWIYSIITVQTMGGYPGSGYNQISRMNGGYGNRPLVSVSPGIIWNERFNKDIGVMLKNRDNVISEYELNGKKELLWLYGWDGETGLRFNELAPYYIEVCRRIRFAESNGNLIMKKKSTNNCRISSAKQQNGNVGDPWIPIEKGKESKALTIGRSGYRYDKLCDILFSGNYTRNICSSSYNKDKNVLLCSALARGQGKTEGFHERTIPIPRKAKNLLKTYQGKDLTAKISKIWIEDTRQARRTLRKSILNLIRGAQKLKDPNSLRADNRADKWLLEFTERVDRIFFKVLWDVLGKKESSTDSGDSEFIQKSQCIWRKQLKDIMEDVFEEAKKSMPLPTALHYRAVSKTTNQLNKFLYFFLKESCDESSVTRGKTESIPE